MIGNRARPVREQESRPTRSIDTDRGRKVCVISRGLEGTVTQEPPTSHLSVAQVWTRYTSPCQRLLPQRQTDRQTISIKPIHRACGAAFVTIPVTEYRWSHVPACRPISRPGLGRVPAGWEGPLVRYGHGGRGFSRGFGPIYIWRGLHADRSMELYGVVYQFQDLIELSRRYSIPQVYQNRFSACQEPRSLFHARRVFLEQQPIMGCPVCRQYGVLGR